MTSFPRTEDPAGKRRERIVKVRRDRDGRREIWFRNKNRILGITRIGEAIWSPRGAKWAVGGCRGEGTRGREETYRYGEALRQRNTEERIIAGKPTTLRRPTSTPPPSARPPSPSSLILVKRSRYLLLEETFCSVHSVILRTLESCDYSEPIDDAKSRRRLRFATPCAIRITWECATRESPFPILYNA